MSLPLGIVFEEVALCSLIVRTFLCVQHHFGVKLSGSQPLSNATKPPSGCTVPRLSPPPPPPKPPPPPPPPPQILI